LGVVLICIVSLGFFTLYLSKQIENSRAQIIETLTKELGFPITVQNIEMGWVGRSLGLVLKNITFEGSSLEESIHSVESIKISPDLKALLFEQKLNPHKMTLYGLKMTIAWSNKNNLSFTKQNQEKIIKELEKNFLSKISKIPIIKLVRAEIDWQGPSVQIKQFLNSEFKWIGTGFVIKGKHQLQIRQGDRLPEARFLVEVSPQFQSLLLDYDMDGLGAQCEITPSEKQGWKIEGTLDLADIEIEKFQKYYIAEPEDAKLLLWLKQALLTGTLYKGTFKVQGLLQTPHIEGELAYNDVDLLYAEGWPKIEAAKGTLKIENDKVSIQLLQGTIGEAPIGSASAVIAPIGKQNSPVVVKVAGALSSTLEKGLVFLKQSPLQDSIAKSLTPLDPRGPMQLTLNLSIPINGKNPLSVKGSVSTHMAQLKLADLQSPVEHVTGSFHFTEKSLEASDVTAQWMEHPLELAVETITQDHQSQLKMMGSGSFSTAFLQKHLSNPLLDKLEGQSVWTVAYTTPLTGDKKNSGSFWSFTSDLKGTAIHLPEPLEKEASSVKNLMVTVDHSLTAEHRVNIQLAKVVNAKLVVEKLEQQYKVKSGNLVFGTGNADWISKEALVIGGEVAQFNTNWIDFLDESDEKNLFPPIEIDLVINDLKAYGLQFLNTRIKSNFTHSPLEWEVQGPHIKGSFRLPEPKDKVLMVNLDYLKIVANDEKESNQTDFLKDAERSVVLFRCKDLQYEQRVFGEVAFKLVPTSYGYEIAEMSLNSQASTLVGKGEWRMDKEQSSTKISGKITSRAMGELFSSWGFPTTIREANGTIQYDFSWPKSPFQFDIASIQGTAELRLNKGRILGVNPGLGRVLGLLNVENIPRRLKLDFSDVFKQGFTFDSMKGKFEFRKGTVYTPQVLLNAPMAKVELTGTANLQSKVVDLDVSVVPQSGVGLPVAAAIALVNPIAGAGVAVLNQITGATGNITQQRFHVTGTWNFPNVQSVGGSRRRIERNNGRSPRNMED
jgi:uncharacterized protein (TIGR02099 family)